MTQIYREFRESRAGGWCPHGDFQLDLRNLAAPVSLPRTGLPCSLADVDDIRSLNRTLVDLGTFFGSFDADIHGDGPAVSFTFKMMIDWLTFRESRTMLWNNFL